MKLNDFTVLNVITKSLKRVVLPSLQSTPTTVSIANTQAFITRAVLCTIDHLHPQDLGNDKNIVTYKLFPNTAYQKQNASRHVLTLTHCCLIQSYVQFYTFHQCSHPYDYAHRTVYYHLKCQIQHQNDLMPACLMN